MLELKKEMVTEDKELIKIVTSTGNICISFSDNLDLYWYCYSETNNMYNRDLMEFIIDKENYYIYSLFLELYNNIINCNPYCKSQKTLKRENGIKPKYKESHNNLVVDDIICWHSDDDTFDKSNSLTIAKADDAFLIQFRKNKIEGLFNNFIVRICNSGSRYAPYNIAFMNMYQKLCDYQCDFHQINIEELLYEQEKVRSRKS